MKIPSSITIGLLAGSIYSLAWYLLARSMGFYSADVYLFLVFIRLGLLLLGVFTSVLILKRKNKGFINFKSALKTGMIYCVAFAIVTSIFTFIYNKFISPDTIDFFLAEAKKYAETVGKIKGEQLDQFLNGERNKFGAFALAPSILFIGLIISLLVSAILQKKNPHQFSEN
jgi:hypothetical protein